MKILPRIIGAIIGAVFGLLASVAVIRLLSNGNIVEEGFLFLPGALAGFLAVAAESNVRSAAA